MLTLVYTILKEHLKTKVTQLKEIAWYQEQNTKNAEGAVTTLPAAYIRFEPFDTKTFPLGWQRAQIRFEVILNTDNLKQGDDRILETNPAFSNQLLSDKIYMALNDFSGLFSNLPGNQAVAGTEDDYQVFNSITRVQVTPPHSNKAIIESSQVFTCQAIDASNVKKYRRPTQAILDAIMDSLLAGEGLTVKLIDSINEPI